MNPLRTGYASSEFMAVVAAKLTTALVVLGVLRASQEAAWQTAIGNALMGAVAIWQLASMVRGYVEARTGHKAALLDVLRKNDDDEPPPTAGAPAAAVPLKAALFFLILSGLLLPTPAFGQSAGDAGPTPCASRLPWRRSLEQRLKTIEANQHQQQPPQTDAALLALIQQLSAQTAELQRMVAALHAPKDPAAPAPLHIYSPPLQQIPLGGQPLQQIPLGGQPHQLIPLGPAPQQHIYIGPPPEQQIPLGGQPMQQIPLAPTPPRQQIPLGAAPQLGDGKPAPMSPPGTVKPTPGVPKMPEAAPPTGYQHYSLWRPQAR